MKTTPKAGKSETWQVVGVCVFLTLAVLTVFGQTTGFGFVNYDDPVYVCDNAQVAGGLSLRGVAWAFTHAECSLYHPLTMLSLRLDYQLHGLHPGGYHLTNVLIHAATALLLFLILRRMTGALWRSAFVAAVFAVHPLRAESVAWVAERKDVLAAFFFMLAIGAYVHYVRKPDSLGRHLMVPFFFLLALLSKPTVVTLPFVLLLLDYWPLRIGNRELGIGNSKAGAECGAGRPFWGLVREKIPLLALAALACGVTYLAAGREIASGGRIPMATRIGNALVSYVVYLRQTVWPSGLAAYYPYPEKSQPIWEIGLALFLLAGISGGALALWRRCPWFLTGWFWYLGMLVPVIGVVQLGKFAHADRDTYLPQIGLSVLLTWAAADMTAGWRRRRVVLGGLFAATLVALTSQARSQTSCWRDSRSLWTQTLACTTDNIVALNNLGGALAQDGQLQEAIAQYHKALEINPAYADACNNLGAALAQNGEQEEAVKQYRRALELDPDYAEARGNLAAALLRQGAKEEAIAQYRAALESKPDYIEARNGLAHALAVNGDVDGAIAQYRKLLEINPAHEDARYNLGVALFSKGDWDGAVAQYRQAIQLNPRSADTRANLGAALLQKGETREAVECWQQALEISPGQVRLLNDLAWVLATTSDASLRNGAKAAALASQANQLSGGGSPMILRTLAAAYAEEGKYDLAVATARRALDLAVGQKSEALAGKLQTEIKLYEASNPARVGTTAASAPSGRDGTTQGSAPTGRVGTTEGGAPTGRAVPP